MRTGYRSFSQRITRGVLIMSLVNVLFAVALINLLRPALVESTTQDYVNNVTDFVREDIKFTFLVQDDISTQYYLTDISKFPWLQSVTLYSKDGTALNAIGVSNWNPSLEQLSSSDETVHVGNIAHKIDTIFTTNEVGANIIVGWIHISVDGSSISSRLNRLIYMIILILVFGMFFLWYVMRTFAIRATRSILDLSNSINAIRPDDPTYTPINIKPDSIEVSDVQSGVNAMLEGIATNRSELESRVRDRTYELASALEHNNRAEAVRRSLIMNLSHDLKTPLSSLIMYLDHALECLSDSDDEVSEAQLALASSRRSATALWEEIKTLLQYSSSTDVTDSIALSSYDVPRTVESSIDTIRQIADASNNRIDYSHSGAVLFRSSERLFVYVLDNLLANANKACNDGCISVNTEVTDENVLTLSVHDDGVGIPIDERENIFAKHVSLDDKQHSGPRGMGIGLSLTKFWIDQLDGTIELDSVQGQFTKFTVCIKQAEE